MRKQKPARQKKLAPIRTEVRTPHTEEQILAMEAHAAAYDREYLGYTEPVSQEDRVAQIRSRVAEIFARSSQ